MKSLPLKRLVAVAKSREKAKNKLIIAGNMKSKTNKLSLPCVSETITSQSSSHGGTKTETEIKTSSALVHYDNTSSEGD